MLCLLEIGQRQRGLGKMETKKIRVKDLSVFYGDVEAVKNISLEIHEGSVTAFIGPSGSGNSTLLRSFNRMNDEIINCSTSGEIFLA